MAPLSCIVLAIDQVAKNLAMHFMAAADAEHTVLSGWVGLALVRNDGGAFGLFRGGMIVFVTVAVLVLCATLLVIVRRVQLSPVMAVAIGMQAGGACGNLVDRLRFGYAVDFIHVHGWPVFNLADVCVVTGAALMAGSWALSDHSTPPGEKSPK